MLSTARRSAPRHRAHLTESDAVPKPVPSKTNASRWRDREGVLCSARSPSVRLRSRGALAAKHMGLLAAELDRFGASAAIAFEDADGVESSPTALVASALSAARARSADTETATRDA
jgi:hypothetical protein